jgi:O-antigen ligase
MGWALLSALLSGRFWAAFVGEVGSMLGWTLLAAMTAVAIAGKRYAPQVRRILMAAAWPVLLCESALLFFQVATGSGGFSGTMPNSTYLGEALLLLLPWALGDAETPAWQKWPRLATVALTIGALAAAGARIATVVAAVWAIWTLLRRSTFSARVRTVGVLVVIAVVVAAGLVYARAEILGSTSLATLGKRPGMVRVAAAATTLRPALGWGPDGFMSGGSAASTPELASTGSVVALAPGAGDPHSLVLWVLVSTGIVGLGLFVWFSAEVVLSWRRRIIDGVEASPAIWSVAGPLIVFLTAPATPLVLPLFALVLGVSLGDPSAVRQDEAKLPVLENALVAACIVALGLASAVLALDAGTRATFEVTGADRSPSSAAGALRVARIWAVDPHLWYLASTHIGYARVADSATFADRSDLQALSQAAALDRRSPFYPLELGWVLRVYGESPGSIGAAYEEALRRYPIDARAHADYAGFLAGIGRVADAEKQLTAAQILIGAAPEETVAAQQSVLDAQAEIARQKP